MKCKSDFLEKNKKKKAINRTFIDESFVVKIEV